MDKDSAFLNVDNERVFAVDADHCDICTFDSATSQKYMLVGGYIAVLARDLCRKPSTQILQCAFSGSYRTTLLTDHGSDQ